MKKILTTIAALAIAAAACSSDDPVADAGPDVSDGGDGRDETVIDLGDEQIVLTAGLNAFSGCDTLLDHLRTEAAERVGPFGFNEGGWYGPVFFEDDIAVRAEPAAEFAEEPAEEAAAEPTADGAFAQDDTGGADLVEGVDFSGTNVQEVGVDEADIIKTDGERVFVVASGQLVVVDAARREVTGTVSVPEGWSPEMFITGDSVLLISRGDAVYDDVPVPLPVEPGIATADAEAEFAETSVGVDVAEDAIYPDGEYWGPVTVIQRFDLDGGVPEPGDVLRVAGDYVSARSVDGVARVIIRSHPQQNFPFVYPQNEQGYEVAETANRQAVLNSELEDWLPSFSLESGGSVVDSGILPACDDVHAPTEFSGFGVTSVMSIPVDGDIEPAATTSVLAPGDTVYASTESLYISTTTWIDSGVFEDEQQWEDAWDSRRVNIHRFDITDPDQARYTASGSVPGEIHNQFSLSEHAGHLRVVTTTGDPWGESSDSQVRVLREAGGELTEVGMVGDIGRGEQVQSVRFVGDTGYVVTFRQVDPFYTIDLSDPQNPRIVGELKIPGFSSYLHPIGEDLVLGVGTDATDEGFVTGAKVSLFDVSNLADPREIAVWTAPEGWNDVGWDHRSFLWWEPEKIAVVPVNVWQENWAGAVVLRVADDTITELGRIDHVAEDGQVLGATDCEVLTIDDLPGAQDGEFDTELQYIVAEEYGLALVCDAQEGGAHGYDCYADEWFTDEAVRMGVDLGSDQRIEICWPGQQLDQIVRSMIIGDDLWTLSFPWGDISGHSNGNLQVNDITSLARLGSIPV
jgi:hypothetical protein